eukprot:TRINITY_DN35581_c0_g2_i1.p1 TRINITY_DN35581_c0_g2~~TRINITY_DN35581_c0_g2_i1.p1  ORF type:complete len:687 (+),score=148.71 TRINITY_DN35581_c0_g2_i1:137-2197(+)
MTGQRCSVQQCGNAAGLLEASLVDTHWAQDVRKAAPQRAKMPAEAATASPPSKRWQQSARGQACCQSLRHSPREALEAHPDLILPDISHGGDVSPGQGRGWRSPTVGGLVPGGVDAPALQPILPRPGAAGFAGRCCLATDSSIAPGCSSQNSSMMTWSLHSTSRMSDISAGGQLRLGSTSSVPQKVRRRRVPAVKLPLTVQKERANPGVIAARAAALEAEAVEVRCAAIETLRNIVAKGEASSWAAIECIAPRLEHGDPNVRASAVKALAAVTAKGDIRAIDAAVWRLQSASAEIRKTAIDALWEIVEVGNADAVGAVAALLTSDDPNVQQTVVESLADIAGYGNHTAIESVSVWLEHPEQSVVAAAMQVLARVARRDVKLLLRQLQDPDFQTRDLAVKHFKDLYGDDEAALKVVALFDLEDDAVRTSALQALENVADTGDAELIFQVCRRLEHPDERRQQTAVKALQLVCERGDSNAIIQVAKRLEHSDVRVRSAAVRALELVAIPGHLDAIEECLKRLQHPNEPVRQSAARALSACAPRGTEVAVKSCIALLADTDPRFRKSALNALGFVTERSDKRTLAYITAHMEDENKEVRQMAVQSKGQIMDTPMNLIKTPRGYMLKEQNRTDLLIRRVTLSNLALPAGPSPLTPDPATPVKPQHRGCIIKGLPSSPDTDEAADPLDAES